MLDRDPLYKPGIGNTALQYTLRGEPDKAMSIVKRAQQFLTDDPFLARNEAMILNFSGRIAEALPLAEFSYERAPSDLNSYVSLAVALAASGQFGRVADLNVSRPGIRINALLYLGRPEEASILAYQWANSGQNPGALFNTLVKTGKFEELIDYVEQHWADLDALDAAFPATFGFGYQRMILVAQAYRHSGNQPKFEQAMSLVRRALELQILAGADASPIHGSQAQYWILADEPEKAMDALQKYADKGGAATPRLSDMFPLYKALEGLPRYEAIQAQLLEHLNGERVKLRLEPLGPERA
jgi:hypothetical protein